MSFQATSSQTVGPYFRIGVEPLYQNDIAGEGALGERIEISGTVHDGDGVPVSDAFIEVWQADAEGIYRHPEDARSAGATSPFKGFGRIAVDDAGVFRFSTVKPGRTPGPQGQLQASHLVIQVFMRGILKPLLTRLYFAGDAALAEDPVLALVPEARRPTLIAERSGDAAYRWDVYMQGERETVAFSC